MPSSPCHAQCSLPPSEFKRVERQLSEKLRLQGPADHAKDEGDVFGLLEDLQETIFHYQVCSRAGTFPDVNKGNRCHEEHRLTTKDSNQ